MSSSIMSKSYHSTYSFSFLSIPILSYSSTDVHVDTAQNHVTQTDHTDQIPAAQTCHTAQRHATQTCHTVQIPATQMGHTAQTPATQTGGQTAQIPATQTRDTAQRPAMHTGHNVQVPATQTGHTAQRHTTQTGHNVQIPTTQTSYTAQRPATQTAQTKYIPPHQRNNNNNLSDQTISDTPSESKVFEQEKKITRNNFQDIPVEITATNVPKPVNTFAEIEMMQVLRDNVRNRCKYMKLTPIQRYAIPAALAGRDLMVCAQTESGKTAAFCFPVISKVMEVASLATPSYIWREPVAYPLALILSPTPESCSKIFKQVNKFCFQTGVKVAVVYGGAPFYPQLRSLEMGVDILVATPGRLTDLIQRSKILLQKVKYLVIDEADRMLDMGFEPHIRRIVECSDMPPSGPRQTMLFSATFPTEIQNMASDFLRKHIYLAVGQVCSSLNLIKQKVVFVEEFEKQNCLRNLLHDQRAKRNLGKNALTLIFVKTIQSVDSLEKWLCRNGFSATAIHGDKVQSERERALISFKNGVTPILVATDFALRRLDLPQVDHVINFDLPRDIDSYIHRIGRTGQAGKSGLATSFFNAENSDIADALYELIKESRQEVPDWLSRYAKCDSSSSNSVHGSSKFGGRNCRSGNDSSCGTDYSDTSSNYYSRPVAADYPKFFGDSARGGSDGDWRRKI